MFKGLINTKKSNKKISKHGKDTNPQPSQVADTTNAWQPYSGTVVDVPICTCTARLDVLPEEPTVQSMNQKP